MKTLIVVDCQNDFIDGSLACHKSFEAIENIIQFINNGNVDKVIYSMDYHKPTNKSFKINGGIWPNHCVQGTPGCRISSEFQEINNNELRPNKDNIYKKGINDDVEEYSAYYANNGKQMIKDIDSEFIVCGLASEYCVRETLLELLKNHKDTSLFLNGVGYVNLEDHNKNIKDLKYKGIKII